MGYTHYIRGLSSLSHEQRLRWVKVTNDMIDAYNKTASNPDKIVTCGESELTLHKDKVFVNGLGDNGHETLYISNNLSDFEFCKTARKPYDKVVAASYMWVSESFEGVTFSSDGYDEELADAKAFLNEYLATA